MSVNAYPCGVRANRDLPLPHVHPRMWSSGIDCLGGGGGGGGPLVGKTRFSRDYLPQ